MEKTEMTVNLSIKQKEQAAEYAHKQGRSLSDLVREALAVYTGYDLAAENASRVERRGRPRKYATKEQAKEAARQRARDNYGLYNRLLEDHRRQQRRRDAANMERSLVAKGVAID